MSAALDPGPEEFYPLSKRANAIADALKKPSDKVSKVVLEPFHRAARWFPLGVYPFVRVGDILTAGAQKRLSDLQKASNPPASDLGGESSPAPDEDLILFDRLKDLIPEFDAILNEMLMHPTLVFDLSKYMTDQGQSQRQVDSSGIKTQIFYYMDSVTQPEIIAGLKSVTRGFNHTIFGRLLVPRKSLDAFDRNPEDYMNKVRTRVIRPTSLDFPTFLYDEGVDYDPDDMDNGLLRGKLLVKVYRHLFTGPSTALLGPVHIDARPTKPQRYRQHGCDPQTIAYAAVQTYFTLSSAKEWKPETQVSGVDLVAFYNQIIRLFNPVADEDDQEPEEPREPDPWVQETLDWWNFQVGLYRGREHQNRSGTETEDESADDPMEVIKVQRRRRRQAKRGKNASTNNVDHNVDPVLQAALNPQHNDSPSRQAASRENAVTNDNLDNVDPVLRAAPNPQHENAPAEQSTHNHQNDAPLPQNPDALESNLQVQSQGCDSQPREDSTSTPRLTDLDMNRQGAAEPPVTDSNACKSRAQKKRQASSEAASDAKKKKKASVGVRTRSKRKNRS
ncbi:hypothetical protein F5887DRAFT_1278642 [Amanita rubescens]|nr:hypothetical protein F5887DRAFT_1278642 [Amanita rubescens]